MLLLLRELNGDCPAERSSEHEEARGIDVLVGARELEHGLRVALESLLCRLALAVPVAARVCPQALTRGSRR